MDDPDQGDQWEIMAFGDHLGADEDVVFLMTEFLEGLMDVAMDFSDVAVEAADPGGWEDLAELFEDPFGPIAGPLDLLGSAFGAGFRITHHEIAMMAFEHVILAVIRKEAMAVRAGVDIAAVMAADIRAIAPAVDQ